METKNERLSRKADEVLMSLLTITTPELRRQYVHCEAAFDDIDALATLAHIMDNIRDA